MSEEQIKVYLREIAELAERTIKAELARDDYKLRVSKTIHKVQGFRTSRMYDLRRHLKSDAPEWIAQHADSDVVAPLKCKGAA